MRTFSDIADDERAVMVFVLLGTVLLALSIIAGAYFVRVRLQSQKEITDTAGLKELDVRIENLENELESAVWEAGQEAVEKVREETSESGERYTTPQLRSKVGENTTTIFENYFEENHEGTSQLGEYNVHVHLRPLRKDRPDIEILPLYVREQRDDEIRWEELPGFFRVERKVHVDILNERTDTFSSRKLTINRTVETNFFLLAERMQHFRLQRIRKTVDLMTSAYMHMKIFDSEDLNASRAEEDWFDVPFSEHFNTGWLADYDGLGGSFGRGEERDAWEEEEEDQRSYALRYKRDEGKIRTHDLLTEEELENMSKLALLLEQARVFRSLDNDLLDRTAEFFQVESDTLLEYLGEGVGNKVNLEALIIKLFQEKGTLSERISYPGPFLNRTLEGDFLSVIKEKEDWVNTSFGMMKRLFRSEMLDDENGHSWRFEDLSDNITSVTNLPAEKSYLRTLISLYSNVLDVTFNSFKVDEPEVREHVEENIGDLGPLPWMENLTMIGRRGVENVTGSILHTAKNLSVSLGFKESDSVERAVPFYYMYFLSDWGFDHTSERRSKPEDRLNTENMREVIHGKINDELSNRRNYFEETKGEEYDSISRRIARYNKTMKEWDEEKREGWRDVWDSLNVTQEIVDNLSSENLFHEGEKRNTTSALNENHSMLVNKTEEIENDIEDWADGPKENTTDIMETEMNFTKNKWLYEAYRFLLDEEDEREGRDALELIDDFLNASSSELTDRYDWTLSEYRLSRDIEIPPSDDHISVGYATLGNFTGHLQRDFLLPLNHSNSYKLFKRLNLNVFDLVGRREDREDPKNVSRLLNILLGEGDPHSDHLSGLDSIERPLEVEKEDIHSENLSDINTWWIQDGYDRSIDVLEETKEEMADKADSLTEQEVSEDAYRAYGDASFYRTAEMFLAGKIEDMQKYRDVTAENQKVSGNAYRTGEDVEELPVCNLPLGGLTVWNNRSLKYGSSYTLDLDFNLKSEGPLVEFHDMSETATRHYEGELSSAKEWINPFAANYNDYYSTTLSTRFSTSGIELTVKVGESKVFSSEKYSSGEIVRNYAPQNHTSFTELETPMPLLEREYKPHSKLGHEIKNVSFDRNVFNASEDEVKLAFEVQTDAEPGVKTNLTVEVIKSGGNRNTDPKIWDRYNHYSGLKGEQSMGEDRVSLFEKGIEVEGETEMVSISFDIPTSSLPEERCVENHLMLRTRPDIFMDHMPDTKNLTQRPATSTDPVYSYVPSFTTAEQIFLVEEDKEAYMGVFSTGRGYKRDGSFDFIETIPKDSWLIEKDDIPFLIDFDEIMEYRDAISGRHGPALSPRGETGRIPEVVIDPDVSETKISRLPESRYRSVFEDTYVTVFMAASGEENHFYPARVLPEQISKVDQEMWDSFKSRMKSGGGLVGNEASIVLPELFHTTGDRYLEKDNALKDPGLGTGGYIYYDLENVHGSERANKTLRPVESFGEFIDKIEVRREGREDILGSGEKSGVVRDSGLFHEFLTSDLSKREELFLAACRAGDEMGTVDELKEEHPIFGNGSIALSIDILEKNRTEQSLEWFENENFSEPAEEFKAFLSFNDQFLKELPDELGDGDMSYKEAIGELNEELKGIGMNFTEARRWEVSNLTDIDAIEFLRDRAEDRSMLSSASHGIRPNTMRELNESGYSIDMDEFSNHLDELSSSRYFAQFVQELNAGDHKNLPSFYFAARTNRSEIDWMPFGEKGSPLLINDRVSYYNMTISQNFTESELKRFINNTVTDFSQRFQGSEDTYAHRERALVIMDVRGKFEFREEEKRSLKNKVREVAEHHSPDRQTIGAAEIRREGEPELRYVHL
ncbi:MAG: hypothetical protein V5A88_03175 [Candidatus Thermoplasmatota archaeon]